MAPTHLFAPAVAASVAAAAIAGPQLAAGQGGQVAVVLRPQQRQVGGGGHGGGVAGGRQVPALLGQVAHAAAHLARAPRCGYAAPLSSGQGFEALEVRY